MSLIKRLFIIILLTVLPIKVFANTGTASYYSTQHHGHKTASGEVFNMYALTAASRTLPLGSHVKVTNVSTGQSVIVKINDRGPAAWTNRVIDLSQAAFSKIGNTRTGTMKVNIEPAE